jgi:hypothetical protein
LPQLDVPIKEEIRKVKGYQVRIISNGVYQLAMVSLEGWTSMEFVPSKGLHPESEMSEVINVADKFSAGKTNQKIYSTLMLWKKAGEKWANDELVPIKKIQYDTAKNNATILFSNGDKKVVSFD